MVFSKCLSRHFICYLFLPENVKRICERIFTLNHQGCQVSCSEIKNRLHSLIWKKGVFTLCFCSCKNRILYISKNCWVMVVGILQCKYFHCHKYRFLTASRCTTSTVHLTSNRYCNCGMIKYTLHWFCYTRA